MAEIQFEVLSWNNIYKLLIQLAYRIQKSGYDPEIIVGISRGGLLPARIFSDLLDNQQLANLRVEFYTDIHETRKKPIITQPLSLPLNKKRVLLVDDITDTGKSLQIAWDYVQAQALDVKTVTIYHKPWSSFKPDFYIKETEKWIIFPWEYHESIKKIGTRMFNAGMNRHAVEQRLIEIGFQKSLVTRFLKEIFGSIYND